MQKSDDLSLKTTAAKKVKVWIDSYLSFILNTTKSIDIDKVYRNTLRGIARAP